MNIELADFIKYNFLSVIISIILFILIIVLCKICNWEIIYNIVLNTNIGIIIYAILLSIFVYIQKKYNNNKEQKEYCNNIKNVAKLLFSNELKSAIKLFVNNNDFNEYGICNYINNNDIHFNLLKQKSYDDKDNKIFSIDENTPLFYVRQKDNEKEYIIYVHPLIIEMIKDNDF